MAKYAKDLWIGIALFAVAFGVRLWLALQLPFPQLDDPAAYIQVARHIAGGRGLVSDVLWNYWIVFPSVTHPSNEFWMPLASLLMAGSVRVFGDNLLAAQLPALIAGSLLPPLTYGMGRTLWPGQRRWSVMAAILIVISAVLVHQSASADSSAIYTLFASLALFSGALAIDQRRAGLLALSGVFCSLSYLTRSHGLLLPVSIGLLTGIALRVEPRLLAKFMAALALGFVVLVGIWSWRNLTVFGSIQPASLLLASAARNYGEWFNYGDLPSWAKTMADGFGPIVNARLNGLGHCLSVILLSTFPFGLIGLPVALFRREMLFRVFAVYGVALLLAGLIFTVPSLTGSFYHSVGPYAVWGALGCSAALKYLHQRPRMRIWAVAGYAMIAGLMIGQAALAWPSASATSHAEEDQFEEIARWVEANVPPDEPIITTQANTLNYATGHSALTLPPLQDVTVLRQLADRYGARYVVVTEQIGLYPSALDDPAARAVLMATLPGTYIYELQR
jgi:4-amino-4-deoxy-L-arabinose transferase-like glycosyltransferase